jgi:hypothetical protein
VERAFSACGQTPLLSADVSSQVLIMFWRTTLSSRVWGGICGTIQPLVKRDVFYEGCDVEGRFGAPQQSVSSVWYAGTCAVQGPLIDPPQLDGQDPTEAGFFFVFMQNVRTTNVAFVVQEESQSSCEFLDLHSHLYNDTAPVVGVVT